MLKIVFIFLQIALIANCYKVALVEFFWDDQDLSLLPLDRANKHSKSYDAIVDKIKRTHDELDLVVFPEATLVDTPWDTPQGREGMTAVPKPEDNEIPCNSTKNYPDFFKLLSCTAQKHNTYLVVNLKEIEIDSNGIYNTDVVFDRTGRVIARYRKYNLYDEPDTNITTKPEYVTFDTDFGKTFGIFTCFDLFFKSPAEDLVRQGVENFIFPTFWIPELPFITNTQSQQMWAQGNDVTVLAAGAAYQAYGSAGVGVYLGNKGVVAKYDAPRTDNYYLYHDVPEKDTFSPSCSLEIDDNIAEEMDNYTLLAEDLSEYAYKKLDLETSKSVEEKLCQNRLCCDFKIDASVSENRGDLFYEYFIVVRSGFRTIGNDTHKNLMEICGLVACTGNSLENCGKRFPSYKAVSWPITFEKIEISANFENTNMKAQYPNTVLADFSPIPPPCTTWKAEVDNSTIKRSFSTNIPITKLLTFSIFGRNFESDL